MPTLFQTYQTEVDDGVVVSSTLISIALYEPGETIDPNDGATIRITDDNTNDGLISREEFAAATGGGGLGQNGGAPGEDAVLWDGSTGSSNTGFLYSATQYNPGDNVDALIDDLPSNFLPVAPDGLSIPCFTAGTLIDTPSGPRAIETLVEGSVVSACSPAPCSNNETRILRKIFRRRIDSAQLANNPKLRPVRIMAGALGNGLPKRDLIVSRQHRMLVRSPVVERMFDRKEVLVAAIRLTALPGIFVDESIQDIEYFHLVFDQHEVIFAEGAQSESFYTGPQALHALTKEAREEILTLFPDLGKTARPSNWFIPAGRLQNKLLERHVKNGTPVLNDMY